VEFITGTGPNAALISLDFGPKTYNFGYQWDATAPTAATVLPQIVAASGGTLTEYSAFSGTFVTGFEYKEFDLRSDWDQSLTPVDFSDDYPNLWWGYFTATNGADWIMPDSGNAGPADITLTNGSFQGFAHETADWPGVTPDAVTAVPEPATLGLLTLASLALLRRRSNGS
jgi:hypothetical protein